MQKKLALLLAAVMVLTSLPMTVFASTNRMNHPVQSQAFTIHYERGMVTGSGDGVTEVNARNALYWTDSSDLVITLGDTVRPGDQFQLHLEGGAQWFFRHRGEVGGTPIASTARTFTLPGRTPTALTGVQYSPVGDPIPVFGPEGTGSLADGVPIDGLTAITLPLLPLFQEITNFFGLPAPSGTALPSGPPVAWDWTTHPGETLAGWLALANDWGELRNAVVSYVNSVGGLSLPNDDSSISPPEMYGLMANWWQTVSDAGNLTEGAFVGTPTLATHIGINWDNTASIANGLLLWLNAGEGSPRHTTAAPSFGLSRLNAVQPTSIPRHDTPLTGTANIFVGATQAAIDTALTIDVGAPDPLPLFTMLFDPATFTTNLLNSQANRNSVLTQFNAQIQNLDPAVELADPDVLARVLETTSGASGTIDFRILPGATPQISDPMLTVQVNTWGAPDRGLAAVTSATEANVFAANQLAFLTSADTDRPLTPGGNRADLTNPNRFFNNPHQTTFMVGHDPAVLNELPGINGFGFVLPNVDGANTQTYVRVTELTDSANQWSRNASPNHNGNGWDFVGDGPTALAAAAHGIGNVNNLQGVNGRELPYRMTTTTFVAGGRSSMNVTVLTYGGSNDRLTIPLVIRTTGDGPYRVRIQSELAGITSGNLLLGQLVDGRTNATAANLDNRVGERRFNLRIAELSANSIQSVTPWEFELRAPRGWHWALPTHADANTLNSLNNLPGIGGLPNLGGQSGDTRMRPHLEGGMRWADNTTGSANIGGGIRIGYRLDRQNRPLNDILVVQVPGGVFAQNRTQSGILNIQGLRLLASDWDNIPFTTDLRVDLRNSVGTVLTNQTFAVGSALNYSITLNRIGNEIPELISGRLEAYVHPPVTGQAWDISRTSAADFDRYHQAASVRFHEAVVDAWWAHRHTVFTLPEEVRFLQVEFEDVRFVVNDTRLYAGSAGDGNRNNPQPWFNTGVRTNDVLIDHGRMVLSNFDIVRSAGGITQEQARFDIHMWLNVQVDFEGPINLTLDNSAFRQQDDNYDVVTQIAYAVRPIEVLTEVRDARVGFQFVTVADFDIVENVAGALLQGEYVYITITDLVSSDMAFAPGFSRAVTDGNLRISAVRTAGNLGFMAGSDWLGATGGQMVFEIERGSTIPSTISFADIQVKIDRTVPFSNFSAIDTSGYDIHVWGPAVARNFRGLYSRDQIAGTGAFSLQLPMNERDLFPVGSISTHYIRIETPGELHHTPFANHVEVPIPSSTVRINGVETDLGVETWIDPVTSSAMVPVRFIAYALGLPGEAVIWDPINSTVTVDALSAGGRIIQFQTGNSAYLVNGVAVRMMNSEGVPVEMQIREGRSFVPFRSLGEAFGIPVSWDAERAVAIYNAPTHF